MTLFNSRATRMLALQIPLPLAELALLVLCWSGCGGSSSRSSTTPSNPALPAPAHVVIVMEENHSYSEIIGSSDAPYINSLAAQGASFTQSFAIAHPSEPNYLALFSGSTQGITGDVCPLSFAGATLGSELLAAGKSFTGYADGLAAAGSTVCSAGEYDRNHVPWTNFSEDSSSDSQPFTSFPTNFADLPTVAFVVPDLLNDMHDGTVAQGDAWINPDGEHGKFGHGRINLEVKFRTNHACS